MKQEYTISIGSKTSIGAIALLMLISSIYIFNKTAAGNEYMLLIPLLLVGCCVLMVLNFEMRKVVLSPKSILCVNFFLTKEVPISAIKGYRINERAITIEPVAETYPRITISNYSSFEYSVGMTEWFEKNLKDLDSLELEKEKQEFRSNAEFGFSEEQRAAKLKQAKKIAIAYNSGGVIAGLMAVFFESKYGVLAVLLYPLAGIFIINKYKLVKFLSNASRSIYGSVFAGIAVPSYILFLKSLSGSNIFRFEHLWIPSIIVGGFLFMILLSSKAINSSGAEKPQIIMLLITSLIYGFGSIRTINCEFDKSDGEMFEAAVVDHRIDDGRHRSYHITLSAWGPEQKVREVSVGRRMYEQIMLGDLVNIKYKTGLFDIPWFVVLRNTDGDSYVTGGNKRGLRGMGL